MQSASTSTRAHTAHAPKHAGRPTDTTVRQADWRYELARRLAITDTAVLIITTATAVLLRFGLNFDITANGPLHINYPTFGATIIIAWSVSLMLFRTRDPRILGDGVMEYRRVVRSTVVMFGCLAIASVLFKWDMSRGFVGITFP